MNTFILNQAMPDDQYDEEKNTESFVLIQTTKFYKEEKRLGI
jgi:hypothetical protein